MSDIAQILSGAHFPSEKDQNAPLSFKRRGGAMAMDNQPVIDASVKPKKKVKISRELQGLVGSGDALSAVQEQVSNPNNTPMVSLKKGFV